MPSNSWIREHTDIETDLSHADLSKQDLLEIHFSGTHLSGSDLSEPYWGGTDFMGTHLHRAKLKGSSSPGQNCPE
jgi:uncharacterized protein YjbI with pentapeptide repeats